MRRILAVGLVACLLAPLPGNRAQQISQDLPSFRKARLQAETPEPTQQAQVSRQVSGEKGFLLLMTVALKGLHGS